MANRDGSLTYSGGEAFAIDVDEETLLSDFKAEAAEMFGCDPTSLILKYFLPGNKKTPITIAKDKDLKRMISFVSDSGTVDVYAEGPTIQNSVIVAEPFSRSPEDVIVDGTPVDVRIEASYADGGIDLGIVNELQCTVLASPISGKPKVAAADWANAITGVDQRFESFEEFRDALHKFSIAHGFSYSNKKKLSHRMTVVCKSKGCPWRISASKLPTIDLVCIKKMNPTHTCEGASANAKYQTRKHWVGKIIKDELRNSPNYKPKDVADYIEREYGMKLNYGQARRAKEFAKELLWGSYKDAYSQLPYLCEKIKETNPGSFATFSTKEDSSFHRLFVSFSASINGFQLGCRPLLFLESYASKSKYQETVLAATAADGNDGIFPVAFAVVDAETDENWYWFLEELKTAVSTSRKITFVSDSHNGLKKSIADVFGDSCYHGYCVRYLAEKLNDDFKGQLSYDARRLMINDFYAAAYASKLDAFENSMKSINRISQEAYDWVLRSEPKNWANSSFEGLRYGHLTSNFGQEFYGWVSEERELIITQIVDVLRGKMMESIYAHRLESSQWTTFLTPVMEEKLQKEIATAESLQVLYSETEENNTFEVHGGQSNEFVNIDNRYCSCGMWQLTGLPCSHAVAVLRYSFREPYDHCSQYFTAESYRVTYAESIHPVPNVDVPMADDSIVSVTPPHKRPRGQPKLKQAEIIDIKRQMQCSKCKSFGHNKRTCPELNSSASAITS